MQANVKNPIFLIVIILINIFSWKKLWNEKEFLSAPWNKTRNQIKFNLHTITARNHFYNV